MGRRHGRRHDQLLRAVQEGCLEDQGPGQRAHFVGRPVHARHPYVVEGQGYRYQFLLGVVFQLHGRVLAEVRVTAGCDRRLYVARHGAQAEPELKEVRRSARALPEPAESAGGLPAQKWDVGRGREAFAPFGLQRDGDLGRAVAHPFPELTALPPVVGLREATF